MHRRVAKNLSTIRLESNLAKRLAPVQARLEKLRQMKDDWAEVAAQRDGAQAAVVDWVNRNGAKDVVAAKKAEFLKAIAADKKKLKAANALYQLLENAHAY